MKKMLLFTGLFMMALFQQASAQITVLSPNGGEILTVSENFAITWEAQTASEPVLVEITYDGGVNWHSITNIIGRSLAITSISRPSKYVKVRVSSKANPAIKDESDGFFEVQYRTIQIITPTSGEKLYPNNLYTIQWKSSTISTNTEYKLSYSTDGGNSWKAIHAGPYTGTTFQWMVPSDYSNNCLIKVATYNSTSVAISQPFSILPAYFQVTSPTSSSMWRDKSSVTVNWTDNVPGAMYHVDFRPSEAAPWKRYRSNIPGNTLGVYGATITLPDLPCGFESYTAQVMVSRVFDGVVSATRTSSNFLTADGPDLDCADMNNLKTSLHADALFIKESEQPEAANIRLYPNPTTKQLSIQISALSKENTALLTIYATTGKAILQKQVTVFNGVMQTTISIASLPAGNYILTVYSGGQIKTASFVKQ